MVKNLTSVKSKKELIFLKKSAEIASLALAEIVKEIQLGQTEQSIFQKLKAILKILGSEKEPFDFVIASGRRAANPHAVPSEKLLAEGESLVLDFGATFKGFCSDLTRTVCLGPPPEKLKLIFEVVIEAQKKAIEAIKPGKICEEIDLVARRIIESAGYQDTFIHGLGHGLGFEVHEEPFLRPKSRQILRPGMCLTVEPGIYLTGWGGVRIEDMVLVTEKGAEVLTFASRELEIKK